MVENGRSLQQFSLKRFRMLETITIDFSKKVKQRSAKQSCSVGQLQHDVEKRAQRGILNIIIAFADDV